ncbi:Hypothetical predicted protein [Paramuricea clavata]|uniref:Uncharacterized protein n=1 Tax=Paramuricea clavata TaxID=317549 RepID=A0A7D9JHS5_PARCT|nr:Hypothetical predicted protein [Paramuricea clavata]
MAYVSSKANVACNLCTNARQEMYERVLINTGKKEFDVAAEIQSLPFSVVIYSKYACRACVQKLKKRRAILTTLNDIEGFFRNSAYKRSADLATIEDQEPTATVSKRICDEATEVSRRTSSPIRSSTGDIANTNIITWPVSPVLQKRVSINETSSESLVTTKTEVRVKVLFLIFF